MKRNRTIALLTVIALCLVLLAGCGSSESSSSAPVAQTETASDTAGSSAESTKNSIQVQSEPDGRRTTMILADKIIELRKRNGWSQEELAEKLNVSRQSISKWEGAQSIPDMNRILKLSEVFGVSTDCLLRDDMDLSAQKKRRAGVLEYYVLCQHRQEA